MRRLRPIAIWNGSNWSAVGSSTERIADGEVFAIAVTGGKVYAGGVFTNAGTSGADNLAVWDGTSWEPFCIVPGQTIGNVRALQVVGPDLYVGGDFQDGAGIPTADYLLACDLASGAPRAATIDPLHPFSGPVKALTATGDGTLYAGGRFGNLENIPAADNVAYLPQGGTWQPMGSGGGSCGCALDAYVRGLAADGTDVFVGTEGSNVAGIAQADHVAKWDGSAWSAIGSNTGGTDGWFPAATNIYDLAGVGSNLFATGTFQNANGEARADNIAFFDGSIWQPVGSNGAGDGPWAGEGSALALVDRQLYAAGNFTSAGGDTQAQSVASFSLNQIIAYPTPTVTAGPGPLPTPRSPPARHRLPPRPTSPRPPQRLVEHGSTRQRARRRSGLPQASRAPRSPASSTSGGSGAAPRPRPTGSSRPAGTCSASRRATAPATSPPRRRSRGSRSRSASSSS